MAGNAVKVKTINGKLVAEHMANREGTNTATIVRNKNINQIERQGLRQWEVNPFRIDAVGWSP